MKAQFLYARKNPKAGQITTTSDGRTLVAQPFHFIFELQGTDGELKLYVDNFKGFDEEKHTTANGLPKAWMDNPCGCEAVGEVIDVMISDKGVITVDNTASLLVEYKMFQRETTKVLANNSINTSRSIVAFGGGE